LNPSLAQFSDPPAWSGVVFEVLAASAVFMFIIAVAAMVGKMVKWAEVQGFARWTVVLLRLVEQLLVFIDVVLLLCFVIYKAIELLKPLIRQFRGA
jgi:hypothetical protein